MIEQNYESKSRIDMIEELKKTVYITRNSNRDGCKTTLDLIEKYGIGHNCLSDAYALGMAHGLDRLEETCELAEEKARADERPKAFGNGFASWYEKGRAEAIDEFRDECESASYIPIGYGFYVTEMKSIRKIAEQLKEKKNE